MASDVLFWFIKSIFVIKKPKHTDITNSHGIPRLCGGGNKLAWSHCQFADYIFQYILLNEKFHILIQISSRFLFLAAQRQ